MGRMSKSSEEQDLSDKQDQTSVATIFKFARFIMANLKMWPHKFNLAYLKGLALLINFHIWLLTIGPKLDFWRIFEDFGFAVLVLKLPTYGTFFSITTRTLCL